MRRRIMYFSRRFVATAAASAIAIVFIFPIYWITAMSFQDAATAASLPPKFIFRPSLYSYIKLFQDSGFGDAIVHSAIIAIGTTILALLLGTPAGYALARFRVASFGAISFAILSVRMLPGFAAVVPLFIILRNLHLYGSYPGVIIAGALGGVAFIAWMMRAFFIGIPVELDDAAMIDGCSRLGAIWRVILPVAAPGLVATTVITVIGAWNEFLFVFLLGGEAAKNMQVVLASMVNDQRAEWGQLAAGGVLTMAPVIIFGLLVRKYFFSGMSAGSVKS